MADLKEILKQIRERTTPEYEKYIENSMEIVDFIHNLLSEKHMKPVDLARALNKNPAEISKWLSGTHNLTLQSISKIEVALDADIIMTPAQAKTKYKNISYVPLAVTAKVNKPAELSSISYSDDKYQRHGCETFKIYTTKNESRTK